MKELFLVINGLMCQKNAQKQRVQFLSSNIIADPITFLFSYEWSGWCRVCFELLIAAVWLDLDSSLSNREAD